MRSGLWCLASWLAWLSCGPINLYRGCMKEGVWEAGSQHGLLHDLVGQHPGRPGGHFGSRVTGGELYFSNASSRTWHSSMMLSNWFCCYSVTNCCGGWPQPRSVEFPTDAGLVVFQILWEEKHILHTSEYLDLVLSAQWQDCLKTNRHSDCLTGLSGFC